MHVPFATKNEGELIFEGGPIFITVFTTSPMPKNFSEMMNAFRTTSSRDEWPHLMPQLTIATCCWHIPVSGVGKGI